ncbi:MAG TPA: isochorismatase family protein [Streptosporangiaceae bacterium]
MGQTAGRPLGVGLLPGQPQQDVLHRVRAPLLTQSRDADPGTAPGRSPGHAPEGRGRGVTQIVLTGVSTSGGVESTARAAHEHGYHVVLATDAMTDRDASAHDNSVQRIFPRLGETATTDDILAMLDKTR